MAISREEAIANAKRRLPMHSGGERCNASIVGNYSTGAAHGGNARFAKPCGNKAKPNGYCHLHQPRSPA